MERVARSRCSFVIDDPMRDLTCLLLKMLTPYPKYGHSSLDDLLLRVLSRGYGAYS